MGIIANALTIILGSLLGSGRKSKDSTRNYHILGVSIIIISLVGFFENVYNVEGENVVSENLILVILSLLLGTKIGEWLRIEDHLSNLGNTANQSVNAFLDAALFFGIGGLQISGPVLLAINHDNSQLLIKCFLDAPFAVVFGATYGKVVALSALPVAAVQVVIALTAYFFSSFFSSDMIAGLCAMGYIILFFSGFNLMTDGKHRVNNINMLPGILLVVLFNVIMSVMERVL